MSMFCVIYQFDVLPGAESAFIAAWEEMTEMIKTHEGGLGSRLHRTNGNTYIAYAQWPDRETWESAGNQLPPKAGEVRERMRKACHQVETLFELDMERDLLVHP